jgi:spermidine/putrescine transport system permease protein
MRDRRSRPLLTGVYALVLILIYCPIVVMGIFSFSSSRYQILPFRDRTTEWYVHIFSDGQYADGFINSLIISSAVAMTATAIGFLCAYSLINARIPGARFITMFLLAPLVVPLLLMGISLRIYFVRLGIQPSLWLVYVGQVIYVLPLAVLNLRNRLAQIPKSHEEAAWVLGASRLGAIRDVVLPACRIALIATLILTFTFAFDEFVIAYFLSNFSITLPIKIWTTLVTGFDPTINALGLLVFLFSMALGLTAQMLFTRREPG